MTNIITNILLEKIQDALTSNRWGKEETKKNE